MSERGGAAEPPPGLPSTPPGSPRAPSAPPGRGEPAQGRKGRDEAFLLPGWGGTHAAPRLPGAALGGEGGKKGGKNKNQNLKKKKKERAALCARHPRGAQQAMMGTVAAGGARGLVVPGCPKASSGLQQPPAALSPKGGHGAGALLLLMAPRGCDKDRKEARALVGALLGLHLGATDARKQKAHEQPPRAVAWFLPPRICPGMLWGQGWPRCSPREPWWWQCRDGGRARGKDL